MSKDENRTKVLDIAERFGARRIRRTTVGDEEWIFLLARGGALVLVVITDEGCDHFVQGGAKWADLEKDLKA